MSFNFFKILKKGAKTKFWPKVLAKFSDIWKFTHYIIYTIKFHRVLKNSAKKTILSFERGDHIESISSEMSFDIFKIPKKIAKPKI